VLAVGQSDLSAPSPPGEVLTAIPLTQNV